MRKNFGSIPYLYVIYRLLHYEKREAAAAYYRGLMHVVLMNSLAAINDASFGSSQSPVSLKKDWSKLCDVLALPRCMQVLENVTIP